MWPSASKAISSRIPQAQRGNQRKPASHKVLTPKFGKESDSWVRFDKESIWWKEGYFQRYSAKRSAVGYLLRFGKGTVELILRDWTVTWLNQGRRMDG
jgi:hypothetical protein